MKGMEMIEFNKAWKFSIALCFKDSGFIKSIYCFDLSHDCFFQTSQLWKPLAVAFFVWCSVDDLATTHLKISSKVLVDLEQKKSVTPYHKPINIIGILLRTCFFHNISYT